MEHPQYSPLTLTITITLLILVQGSFGMSRFCSNLRFDYKTEDARFSNQAMLGLNRQDQPIRPETPPSSHEPRGWSRPGLLGCSCFRRLRQLTRGFGPGTSPQCESRQSGQGRSDRNDDEDEDHTTSHTPPLGRWSGVGSLTPAVRQDEAGRRLPAMHVRAAACQPVGCR